MVLLAVWLAGARRLPTAAALRDAAYRCPDLYAGAVVVVVVVVFVVVAVAHLQYMYLLCLFMCATL